MTTADVDFLIVGQGLAGSLLAWELARRGRRFILIERDRETGASRTAAGLVTPVSGKRLTLHPSTGAWLATAKDSYRDLETHFHQRFFFELPTLRLLRDADEQAYLVRRRSDPAFSAYIGDDSSALELAALMHPRGGVYLKQGGYLDTTALLDAIGRWADSRQASVESAFDHAALEMAGDHVRWQGIKADMAVFCEGYHAMRNPWFRWLPFQPAKGEILTLRLAAAGDLPDAIINKGLWLAPRNDGRHRMGATNDWAVIDEKPTSEGRSRLLAALPGLLRHAGCKVDGHLAGVRPATRDRQPFLGVHPRFPRLAVLNGFGARGSLLIPWHAQRMADFLFQGTPLPVDADIRRCPGPA